MAEEDDMLTTDEAATLAGVTPIAIRQAIRRGTLTAKKRGRDWLIKRSAVDEYARNHGKPRKSKA